MPKDWPDLIVAFDLEVAALLAVLDDLPDDDFAQPTNCPPWDLRELVVHIAFSACASADPRTAKPAGHVAITAAEYYRRPERDTDDYRKRNVDQTRSAAARFPAPVDAVTRLRDAWSTSKRSLETADPSTMVGSPRPATAMSLYDYTVTRLIALVAHAIDVAITLRVEPWTSPAALAAVVPALRELLGDDEACARLGVDDLNFVTLATGRRSLAADEAERLGGERAGRFPLLS